MYAASQAFHNAVAANNPQMPLLIFKDAVFTERDVDVDTGIEFDDYFNLEEDIAIGQTPSNEIRFTLFNDDRLLNNYEFGEFVATIGVLTGTNVYQQTGSVMISSAYTGANYIGSNDYPFIRRNNAALNPQPSFAVKSILIYDGRVWCFGEDGRYAVYRDADGVNVTAQNPLNAFMQKKVTGWGGKGICYHGGNRALIIQENGVREQYEFVPLGVFVAERPKVPDQIRIEMTCNDRMLEFDKDMQDFGPYPCTIGDLFVRMCNHAGVPYRTSSFINSGAVISKRPEDFDSVTMRTVMGWIAESAGSNARFDRDGYLVMDWLKTTGQRYTEHDYVEFQPTWYETQKVSKIHNVDTQSGTENIYGSGDVGYLIQDNPFLRGVS